MSDSVMQVFIEEIHRVVRNRDMRGIDDLVAEGAVLHTPRFLRPITERNHIVMVLQGILKFVDGFEYHRVFAQGNEAMMEFKGRIGEVQVHGIDLITINDQSKISTLTVFIRPTKALEAIGAMEDAFFAKMAAKPSN